MEAAIAYDEVAREAFGEWATPNFPTQAEREFAARWYDLDAACAFFGISRFGWKNWVRAGKIKGGRIVPSSCGGTRKVFTLKAVHQARSFRRGQAI